jgi:hypothetical protein
VIALALAAEAVLARDRIMSSPLPSCCVDFTDAAALSDVADQVENPLD